MNDFLWHYTSLETLEKIFLEQEPRFRATHFRDFCDDNELRWAGNILLKLMTGSEDWNNAYQKEFLNALLSEKRFIEGFYIISFCKHKDHYCQWKNYAPEGCAIGFQAQGIEHLFEHIVSFGSAGGRGYLPEQGHSLPCVYVNDEDKVKKILTNKLKLSKQIPKNFEQFSKFADLLLEILRIKKSNFFFEEEERLVFRYETDLRFEKYNVLNPWPYLHPNNYLYCPLNLEKLQQHPIEIMLSPFADVLKGESIVKRINKEYNLNIAISQGTSRQGNCANCIQPDNCKKSLA